MRYFLLNTKNYAEVIGARLDDLLSSIEKVSGRNRNDVEVYVAVPAFYLAYASFKFPSVRFLAQHLDQKELGSTTGYLVPEVAKSSGGVGAIVNHSEHRLEISEISILVERLRKLEMSSVVCAKEPNEVASIAKLSPSFIAIEPPELIGTGIAVSKAKPTVITESYELLQNSKPVESTTKLLCGAGIVDGSDARKAIELGASGILVASGVVKSRDWERTLQELLNGLIGARQTQENSL
ncbi:MAG: triose-phosphate isomerase [Nitrososphaerota archaeon]|nr:triose-phosphate isomerase [Nitrososphaerota archaeon]